MTVHTTVSPEETADRLAIRELFDAHAHCADRREAKGQMETGRRARAAAWLIACRRATTASERS